MILISAHNITKIYDNHTKALDNVSFSIKPGEFIALLGKNGAGKSTLMQCLIGALAPSSGHISFGINGAEIAWVSQNHSIDWFLSVKDNVRLGARLGGISFSRASLLADEVLTAVGLSEKNCMPEMLSGGQQKRLQVARALAQSPKLYLLDEPTTGLDIEASEFFFNELLSLTHKGSTCLIASHELDLIENFATRIIMLSHGKILDDQTTKNFIEKYSKNNLSLKDAFKNAKYFTQ